MARPIKMGSRQESNPQPPTSGNWIPALQPYVALRVGTPMDIAEFQRGDEAHGFQGSWVAHFQCCKFNHRGLRHH